MKLSIDVSNELNIVVRIRSVNKKFLSEVTLKKPVLEKERNFFTHLKFKKQKVLRVFLWVDGRPIQPKEPNLI